MAKNTDRQTKCFPVKIGGKTIGHLNLLSDDEKLSDTDYSALEGSLIALLDRGAVKIEEFNLNQDQESDLASLIAKALG